MNYLKFSVCIFLTLAASRLIPHPPNFTSLLALSFYVPAFLGIRFIPVIILSFAITDLIIGFHNSIFFTWGSILIIGLISKYFVESILKRFAGVLVGSIIFFVVSNFGVWSFGSYGYTAEGFLQCYIMAIPFFTTTIISTLLYSIIIEAIFYCYKEFENKSIFKKF